MSAAPADILRFLPSADLSRGPFGLLNLGPTRCDDFAIVEALQRQLRTIDNNPERATPQAESVRAELYHAVAQLRDRETRNTLGKRYFRESWVAPADIEREPSALEPSRPFPPTTRPDEEESYPLIVPARFPVRTPRLGFGAAASMLLAGSFVMLLILGWLISMNPAAPTPAPRGARQAAAPPQPEPTPGAPAALPTGPTIPAAAEPPAEAPPQPPVLARLTPAEAKEMLDQLRAAPDAPPGAEPAAAVKTLEPALARFEQRWPEATPDVYAPACLAVGERLLRATRADARQGVLLYQRIEKPLAVFDAKEAYLSQESIVAVAWAAGVLNRVKGDQSVPGRLVSSARTRIAALTASGEVPREHTFATGVAVALDAMARRWARPASEPPEDVARRAWSAWSRCAAALDGSEKGMTARVVADAVDVMLRDADIESSAVAREGVETLLATVPDWRDKDAAPRVVQWFDNPRVRAASLRVLTEWMATRGPVAAVGTSMVLPPDATTVQRRELRDAYALRLGLAARAGSSDSVTAWADASRKALSSGSAESAASAMTALAAAASVAKLNEAAARLWAMDEDGAASAIAAASPEVVASALTPPGATQPRADPTPLTSPGSPPDGEWARRFLALQSESARILLLNQLRNGRGPEGPVDADVLAEAACYGPHGTVRQLAQQAVRDFADRAEVINGLLEAIPDASRLAAVSDLVRDVTGASLPKPSEPSWRAACRRAIVEKLMQMIGDAGDDRADALAALLWESCAGSTAALSPVKSSRNQDSNGASTTDASSPATAQSPAGAAAELRLRWRDIARATPEGSWAWVTFDELDRRHSVRASLATGPVNAYLAERLGGVEMMAQALAGERPARAGAVKEIVNDLAAAVRTAPSAFHQTLAAERAALRLWLVRFGERES
jgi:hypothetical protein